MQDFGFIILSPELNFGALNTTVNSIKRNYNRPALCVVSDYFKDGDIDELSQFCPIYRSTQCSASFVNIGIKNSTTPWNFIIKVGTIVSPNLDKKYSFFTKSESDVLFPVVNKRWNFLESTLNGLLINRNFLEKTGYFPENQMYKENGMSEFEYAKSLWAEKAIQHGCKFKAIVGVRLF